MSRMLRSDFVRTEHQGRQFQQNAVGLLVPVRDEPQANQAERSQARSNWAAVAIAVIALMVSFGGYLLQAASVRTQVAQFEDQLQVEYQTRQAAEIQDEQKNTSKIRWLSQAGVLTIVNGGAVAIAEPLVLFAKPSAMPYEMYRVFVPPCTIETFKQHSNALASALEFTDLEGLWSIDLGGALAPLHADQMKEYEFDIDGSISDPRTEPLSTKTISNC
jgi:hypothetical protein